MDSFRLIRLPAELREQIYIFVLHSTQSAINLSTGKPQLSQSHNSHSLALAQTSRQLRLEILPLFYKLNCFVLQSDHITTHHKDYGFRISWLSALRRWLDLIGDDHRRRLQAVDIDIEEWNTAAPRFDLLTANLIWNSLRPVLDLFEPGTALALRCVVWRPRFETMPPLRLPLRDADAAERAIREHFRLEATVPERSINRHLKIAGRHCLEIVPLIREYEQSRAVPSMRSS